MPAVDSGDGTFKMTGSDYHNEAQVQAMLARGAWGSCKFINCGNTIIGIKMNWVSSLMAAIITWGFAIWCMTDDNASTNFSGAKTWVSQNFTWLYIITQDMWCLFLIYLGFSRFGSLKLGQPNEKPKYNDFTWFCMLFTCGVAVGLYVFGVAEPMYFYRQPTSWTDYSMAKTPIDNDAQRGQMAIFMAVYHWGIHGWVPYIMLALLVGVVSFRWGMPMTIRACFYPLIGDHALGPIGDFIDALSISTTTFGVCTSLGLGVKQIASGMQFLANIGCNAQDNCVAAGGVWDITGYGADNCNMAGAPVGSVVESCAVDFLSTTEKTTTTHYTIIAVITTLATFSVLTGLDRGIMMFSKIAFSLGMVVLLTVLFADNTWYLLNLMVQTTGYYIQWVVQVGFDCEAFQQLEIEWIPGDGNKLWGSNYETSTINTLTAHNFPASIGSSADCGDLPNPCSRGMIDLNLATTLAAGTIAASQGKALLQALRMSPTGVAKTEAAAASMASIYGGIVQGIPCGSGWDASAVDAFTSSVLGGVAAATPICDASIINVGQATACANLWTVPSAFGADPSAFPRCPETTVKDTMLWGTCDAHAYTCPTSRTYYDDTFYQFMNWWTIFYWAWWITWAPFVGFFVAMISRGRTVREVIVGGFVCPTLFAILWFSVLGGLAIKMERTAEMALQVRPDTSHAMVTCAEHYSGGVPITPEAKQLAEAGYYMLSCVGKNDQIYRLMEPYKNLTGVLHLCLWFGLVIFFLTSSDSGSMTDDIISASGLSGPRVPHWQKVFWCWTEGIVAIALTSSGGALGTLQAMSIVIGLPFTVLLCHMVPSLYRALKREMGDEDILNAKRFNTQLLDIFEGFNPQGGSPVGAAGHIVSIVLGCFFPGLAVFRSYKHCFPNETIMPIVYGLTSQCLLLMFIIFHGCEEISKLDLSNTTQYTWLQYADGFPGRGLHTFAWVSYWAFTFINAYLRGEMRRKYKVWGNYVDDFWACLVWYPFCLAQLHMQVSTDGKDTPAYFHSVDELIQQMADAADDITGAPIVQQPKSVSAASSKPDVAQA